MRKQGICTCTHVLQCGGGGSGEGWVCVDGVGDPSVAADDDASDGGDCDAAQHKNEINILCGRSKNYLPQDVETLMSTTHR